MPRVFDADALGGGLRKTTRKGGCSGCPFVPRPALAPALALGPPPLPLRLPCATAPTLYVPLLLDAAGMLSAEMQRDWRSRAPINEWCAELCPKQNEPPGGNGVQALKPHSRWPS